jgi:hypothetical protein
MINGDRITFSPADGQPEAEAQGLKPAIPG